MEKHKTTIGVFGIPQDQFGRGLWSVRADGKGINAVGGGVDPKDSQTKASLVDVLKREFLEEAGLTIEVIENRPLGVFPTADIADIAILYPVFIITGAPVPSNEATEHLWMDPYDIQKAAEAYDKGEKERGLLSGVGKRQWKMAMRFFSYSLNPEFRAFSRLHGE